MGAWIVGEGDRRTTWLASLGQSPVGMASLFECRRMPRPSVPDSRWGYVGNVFVREDARNRGIGSALLTTITTAADERGYARLVLSPSAQALRFFRRVGFIVPDEAAGGDRLLVATRPLGWLAAWLLPGLDRAAFRLTRRRVTRPQAWVVADGVVVEYRARELSGVERDRGFQRAISLNPGWRRFQKRAHPRAIPVMRLTRAEPKMRNHACADNTLP